MKRVIALIMISLLMLQIACGGPGGRSERLDDDGDEDNYTITGPVSN